MGRGVDSIMQLLGEGRYQGVTKGGRVIRQWHFKLIVHMLNTWYTKSNGQHYIFAPLRIKQ